MNDSSHDTPMRTRTQHTKRREVAKQFWNAERLAEKLEPSDKEMELTCRAAVSISAYSADRGRKSVWPSAMDVVEWGCGYDLPGRGKTPTQASEVPQSESYRHVGMLRLALALNRQLQDEVESGATEAVTVTCPVCDSESITAHVGTLPAYEEGAGLVPQNEPRMVALTVECRCTELHPKHYTEVEDEAVEEYQE